MRTLLVIPLAGCAIGPVEFDPVENLLDNERYDRRVKSYQKQGLDYDRAQRRAFEDDFIFDRKR